MNILTFDIEDWFHLLDNPSTKNESDWGNFESRIHSGTERILDFLISEKQPATCFCLGWVGRKYPEVIKKIDAAGFEIASHSNAHQLAYELTPEQFREDLKTSIGTLGDLTGKKINAFRVPGFSFTEKNTWVYDILIECGIEIDSSIFPGSRGHGGFSSIKKSDPFLIRTKNGTIKEFPINLEKIGPLSLAFSGGGYFRMLPYLVLRHMLRKSHYVMSYFHPRDFDKDQPILPGLPIHRRFKSYVGLRSAFGKFKRMVSNYPFISLGQAEKKIDWNSVATIEL
jgi:polysaccharide deacetylase family protein (PEP-CTERM system associated)